MRAFILLAFIGLAASSTFEAFVCPTGGVFPADKCSQTWYQCGYAGEVPIPQKCADGLYFDPKILNCRPKSEVAACVPASSLCPGPGLYPVSPGACSHYYHNCAGKGDAPYKQRCAAELFFDQINKICNYHDKVAACCPTCNFSITRKVPRNIAVPGKPNQYDVCATKCAKPVRKTCPTNQVFNPSKGICSAPGRKFV